MYAHRDKKRLVSFHCIGLVFMWHQLMGIFSSYGFVDYCDRRSATLAIMSLNGRHLFGQPIKVNWAYASGQRENTSDQFILMVRELFLPSCIPFVL
ncbi:hypothetical protein MKW94_013438 [Papaver nudicaule]|uniref:RRM domain-containing protein n=1 Tax=Papaver nudicaule TaxID=74823 RepID=A0AA41S6Q3_PAPNU|nr:hypothetical protein [Papaver nudicaule]